MNWIGSKSIKKYGVSYLFLVPFLLPFILFTVYPLMNAIYYSFFKFNLKTFRFIGIENYLKVLSNPLFLKSILTTFWFVMGAVPTIIIVSIILSSLLIKIKGKLRTIFIGVFYLPEVTSIMTFVLSWKLVYDYRYGIINTILGVMGIEKINWLANPNTSIPAIVAMIVYGTLGVPIILYISAISAIPETLYEAARIDGATEWDLLWKITFPLIMPTTLYLMIRLTIGVFQTFILVYLMTGGGPFYKTTTMSYFMIREAFTNSNYGVASAIGVIFLGIISGMAILQYKYFSKEIEY